MILATPISGRKYRATNGRQSASQPARQPAAQPAPAGAWPSGAPRSRCKTCFRRQTWCLRRSLSACLASLLLPPPWWLHWQPSLQLARVYVSGERTLKVARAHASSSLVDPAPGWANALAGCQAETGCELGASRLRAHDARRKRAPHSLARPNAEPQF